MLRAALSFRIPPKLLSRQLPTPKSTDAPAVGHEFPPKILLTVRCVMRLTPFLGHVQPGGVPATPNEGSLGDAA